MSIIEEIKNGASADCSTPSCRKVVQNGIISSPKYLYFTQLLTQSRYGYDLGLLTSKM